MTINGHAAYQPRRREAETVHRVTLTVAGATLTVPRRRAHARQRPDRRRESDRSLSGGTLNWNGGVMDGAGTSTIQSGATLNLTNSYGQLQRTMTSAGTTNIIGQRLHLLVHGRLVLQQRDHEPHGKQLRPLWECDDVHQHGHDQSDDRLRHRHDLQPRVRQFGHRQRADRDARLLDASAPRTHSGTFAVSASAVLQFSNSQTNTFNGAITGAGSVTFARSGTSTLTATFSPAALTISAGTVNFNQGSAQSLHQPDDEHRDSRRHRPPST